MKDLDQYPITPDFEDWPIPVMPETVTAEDGALSVIWSDGKTSRYHPFLLAENDPSPDTLHPLSREEYLCF